MIRVKASASLYAAGLLWLLVVGGLSLRFGGGDAPYSLDDAWIHLHFAENLAAGHWGMEPGQISVPSSSILWPWLLVPFAGTAFLPWWPLLLNLCFCLLSLKAVLAFLRPYGPLPYSALLALAFANLVGLVYTGMEHSLQVLLALWILLGLRDLAGGKSARRLAPLLVLAPLVRYELLALVLPAILLIAFRRGRSWLLLLPLVFLPLLAYSLWLHHLGLPLLPTSVLAKSGPAAAEGLSATAASLLANALHTLQLPQGRVLGALTAVCVYLGLRRGGEDTLKPLALFCAAALGLHLLAGRTGWLNRYEIQVWLPALLVVLAVFASWLRERPAGQFPGMRPALLTLVLAFAALPYLRTSLETPWGVRNIQEQQAQMARFSREHWPHPVAVNDLGRVSFRNPNTVLDLWGLSSPEALQERLRGSDPAWADRLCRERGVPLVMLYEDWFPTLPDGWSLLGRLRLGSRRVSSDRSSVGFYLLEEERREEARASLLEWARGLPQGVRFESVIH